MTETLIATPTEISYANAQPTNTPTTIAASSQCTIIVTNNLNLRPDPSTNNPLLLTIPAGTALTVTGETKDKQWWQVSYNSTGKTLAGWVSAQFTTSNGKCGAVAVIQPTP
jgi:uncharacterized protein YraI